ncbi:unnamed protein product, partial [Pelagomonas calceolata]
HRNYTLVSPPPRHAKLELSYSEDRPRVRGDARPQVRALLRDGAVDGRALHLALVVDDDAGVVLEVDDDALLSAPGLALADDDGGHDLLPQLGLALLARAHDEVARRRRRQLVQPPLDVDHRDHVQVLRAAVVRAVHHRRHGQAERHAQLVAQPGRLVVPAHGGGARGRGGCGRVARLRRGRGDGRSRLAEVIPNFLSPSTSHSGGTPRRRTSPTARAPSRGPALPRATGAEERQQTERERPAAAAVA